VPAHLAGVSGPDPRRPGQRPAGRINSRTHGCSDQTCNERKVRANTEPSTHGTLMAIASRSYSLRSFPFCIATTFDPSDHDVFVREVGPHVAGRCSHYARRTSSNYD
jgi:hypothetical protein